MAFRGGRLWRTYVKNAHWAGAGALGHGCHWIVPFADCRCRRRRFGGEGGSAEAWASVAASAAAALANIVNMLVFVVFVAVVGRRKLTVGEKGESNGGYPNNFWWVVVHFYIIISHYKQSAVSRAPRSVSGSSLSLLTRRYQMGDIARVLGISTYSSINQSGAPSSWS